MSELDALHALAAADPVRPCDRGRDDDELLRRILATPRGVERQRPRRRAAVALAAGVAVLTLAAFAAASTQLDVHVFSGSRQPRTSMVATSALVDFWEHGLPTSPRRSDHHLPIDGGDVRVLTSLESTLGAIRGYVAPIGDRVTDPPELRAGVCFALTVDATIQSGDCWPAATAWKQSYGAFPPLTGTSTLGDVVALQGYLPRGATDVGLRAGDGTLVHAATSHGYWIIFLSKDDVPSGPTIQLIGRDAAGAVIWTHDVANG